MELLIFIVLLFILDRMGRQCSPQRRDRRKPSMTAAQRELSAQWATDRAEQKRNAAVRKTVERSLLEEDVERLLARVGDGQLANALGAHHSATRGELISRASDLGRDGAYAIAVAYREVA